MTIEKTKLRFDKRHAVAAVGPLTALAFAPMVAWCQVIRDTTSGSSADAMFYYMGFFTSIELWPLVVFSQGNLVPGALFFGLGPWFAASVAGFVVLPELLTQGPSISRRMTRRRSS